MESIGGGWFQAWGWEELGKCWRWFKKEVILYVFKMLGLELSLNAFFKLAIEKQ